ncbi:TPR repeat-containing protein [Phytophthora cinnamomi]|uniref:TPR repeat-containing protein n=1 Tax=Phytophthora cinnamomi TaxID=4785 RepID=UPI003559FDB4|nr:TPR repeat-containing protein [Phytophthora cinnamomi]
MSASMLRQMLVDAAAFLKADRYQEAQDAGRRVTQFDPNSFQAFMCVGLASFHLQQWEDCEEAYRRAADLKPDMPAPWKYLVDLFEARNDAKSKLGPLEKLVEINLSGKKLKRCQKWVAEVATTAMQLKMLPKAFDAWYTLVGEQSGDVGQLSLERTPNEELPAPLNIWLDLVDLLQRPGFSLSECSGICSMADFSSQFFAVASRTDWTVQTEELDALRPRMDGAIAYFMRFHLDALKTSKKKSTLLKTVDQLATSIIQWFPGSKIPAEFLLLRAEDQDSPIDVDKATDIAVRLSATHPKSPMALIYQALACLRTGDSSQARENLVEALAGYSSSSFQECALCVRVQVELGSIALATRDVEGCLNRLALAKKVVADKANSLGSEGPLPSVYSEVKVLFMTATAREYSGDVDKALENYRGVMESGNANLALKAAIAAAELLSAQSKPKEALEVIDSVTASNDEDEAVNAALLCTRGWLQFQLGDLHQAQSLLEANANKVPATDAVGKGRTLKRLAIVYWHLGDPHQSAKTGCFGHLLQAAKLTPSDAEIFSWLGKWYEEVAHDILRAEKCFLKALSISPADELAGMSLCNLYDVQGKYDANVKLWERVTEDQEIAPTWALLRLAQHLVEQNDETAVGKMHLVLRNDPMNAHYWVILAHIYQNFDKQVSAQRSYLKAIELGEEKRIKPVVTGELSDGNPDVTVASMIYADLLFQHAKYLCAEGLYGNAAANLKGASDLMKGLPSSSALSGSVEACKLIGDIHCFAFYLSPENFSTEGSGWVDFISAGRKAYEAAVLLSRKTKTEVIEGPDSVAAERYYDIGLSYWYEAQAQGNVQGIHTSAFSIERNQSNSEAEATVANLKTKASTNFKLALQEDPSCSLAWNGLALVSDNLLVKQFAWARAIQTGSSSDATWANLGMFYLSQSDAVPSTASLAQKSFLQLQSMNPSNPSMWNGNVPSSGNETVDRNYLDALVGLFKAGPSGAKGLCLDAQKLVRAQPWNPQAYILAGTSILKRIGLETKQASHDEVLRQLLRLLQTGLTLAVDANGKEYDAAQLELLICYCFVKLGERDQAIVLSNTTLERVTAAEECGVLGRSVDTELLEARLLSISSSTKSIEKYLGIVAAASTAASESSSSRLVPILIELGGLYEEEQFLDAAISVWKLVASLTATKSPTTTEGDDDVSSTTTALSSNSNVAACFLANLRLAIIHGKKNNVKPARKHIKIAVALAEAGGDSNSSTVAAFVENVLAN